MAQITVCGKATYPPAPTFNYNTRCNELIKKINGFTEKIGIPDVQITLSNRFSIDGASCYRQQNCIELSPFFLLNYEDIPEWLRDISSQDTNLINEDQLNEVINYINNSIFNKFNLIMELTDATEFILFLKNRKSFEKGKDFAIAHELSHMKHYKLLDRFQMFESKKFWIGVFRFFMLAFSLFSGGDAANSISRRLLGEQTFSKQDMKRIVAYINSKEPGAGFKKHRLVEKLADTDAVNIILEKDTEGPVYLFNTLLTSNKAWLKHQPSTWENVFDKNGDLLDSHKHPPFKKRIQYIEALGNIHTNNNLKMEIT